MNGSPNDEHLKCDIAVSISPRLTFNPLNLEEKPNRRFLRRLRAVIRMGEVNCSSDVYRKLLETDSSERALLEISGPKEIPSTRNLYRWWEKRHDKTRLARDVGGTGRPAWLPNWVVCFVLEYLDWRGHAKVVQIQRAMEKFANDQGYLMPSYDRLNRFVKAIRLKGGIQDMLIHLKQRTYFAKYQMTTRKIYTHANHTWVTDGVKLGVQIESGGKWSLPAVLLTVDAYSGLPMGWTIPDFKKGCGHNEPDANDMSTHLKYCILPKSGDAYWGGLPEILQSDNAKIYTCPQTSEICNRLNIELTHSPVRCPAFNGSIERLNKEVKERFAAQFKEFLNRRRRFEIGTPRYIGDFERLKLDFHEFMVAYSRTHIRRASEVTPLMGWQEGLKDLSAVHVDPEFVDNACMHYAQLPITREGIHIGGVAYIGKEGKLPMGKGKKTYPVRYNPEKGVYKAFATISGAEVELVPNINGQTEAVRICREAESAKKHELAGLWKAVQKNAHAKSGYIAPLYENQQPDDEKPQRIAVPKTIKLSPLNKYTNQ